jgi:hypothetical protein
VSRLSPVFDALHISLSLSLSTIPDDLFLVSQVPHHGVRRRRRAVRLPRQAR